MTIAGVFCGVGWAGLGMAPTLIMLYASYALAGLGAAMVYCGCIGVALKWFPDKRGLAAGTIAAGFGAGAMIVLLGGVLLVSMGVWGHDASASNTPAAQSAANAPTQPGPNPQQTNPSGTPAPQTTGQALPQQSAPQQH